MNIEKNIEVRNKIRNDYKDEFGIEYFYDGEEEVMEAAKRAGVKVKKIPGIRPDEESAYNKEIYEKKKNDYLAKMEEMKDLKLGEGRSFCFEITAMGTGQVRTRVTDLIPYPFVIYFFAFTMTGNGDYHTRATLVVSDSPNEDVSWPPVGDNIVKYYDGYEGVDGFIIPGGYKLIEADVYHLALSYPSFLKFVVSSLGSTNAPGDVIGWVSIREIITKAAAKKQIIERPVIPKSYKDKERKGRDPRGKVNWPKWTYGWLNEYILLQKEEQGDLIVERLGPVVKYWHGNNYYCRWRKKLPVPVY